ncbi:MULTISPECIES: hypothetical protein [Microbacterium]|jgi:hypothetical protein|uniref:Uncharacterized protein n=1 Tax=Microbacterium mcarthurae TaxID=3035918 RepID=A0ABW9GDZ7_9MICO|nr:hypothetical protein [Microbacterium sp. ACRRU]MCG7416107.1 hypothetical protein [Microbacterium sp. ACRRU]
MPDPRRLRIDVGPFQLDPDAEAPTWTATGSRAAGGTVTGGWSDWVAFAQRVLQADALWREREARGDAWDQGHAASGAPDAVNPYR